MRKLFTPFILSVFILLFTPSFGQIQYDFGFIKHDSIPVYDSLGSPLDFPWVGGFNSVHFQEFELNFDGQMDLLVFDVIGNKLFPFINEGDSGQFLYTYHPELVNFFPKIEGWLQTPDFNGDGKRDIFTYVPGGIKVYKNISTPGSGLQFQLETPMINYNSNSGFPVNIYLTEVDFPGIVDVDFDGDLDILTFHILGVYLVYYQNLSMELYGDADHLEYKVKDKCWGKFAESEYINSIYMDSYCNYKSVNPKLAGKGPKHTGATITPLNLNGDSLMDILLGDVDFFTLNALTNGGTRDSAHIIAQDTVFPSYDTTINLVTFPLASYLDIDNDSVKELIVSPFESAHYKPEALESVWLYENSGTTDNPNFNFIKRNFFQDEMIEVGDNAMPEVVDVDGDGLKDIW